MLIPNSQIGMDDWMAFAFRYWPDLLLAVLAIGISVFLWTTRRPDGHRLRAAVAIILVATVICGIHVAFTARRNLTLTLLGAEDDRVAEAAYQNFSKQTSLKDAIGLLRDKREDSNVRFYAACLVSKILATNGETTVAQVLKEVQDAPEIKPQFFGTNSVNKKFVYLENPISVQSVIGQQLDSVQKSERPVP